MKRQSGKTWQSDALSCFVIALACALTNDAKAHPTVDLSVQRDLRCGQVVVLTALQAYQIRFGLDVVRKDLPVGEQGTSLLGIQRILRAHGLTAHARKLVSYAELNNFVTPEKMVILPVVSARGGGAHYVILMRKVSNGPLLLVDAPNYVVETDKSYGRLFEPSGGVCLLIEAPNKSQEARVADMRDNVRFESEELQLDPIQIDSKKETSVVLKLINTSSETIAISQLAGTCGCITLDTETRLLDANSTLTINMKINNSHWGQGLQRKTVGVEAHGAKLAETTIIATGILQEEALGVSFNPTVLQLKISQKSWHSALNDKTAEREVSSVNAPSLVTTVRVIGRDGVLPELTVAANDTFLTIINKCIVGNELSFCAIPCITDQLRKNLANSNYRVSSSISITGVSKSANLEYPVTISRESTYEFTQRKYYVSIGQDPVVVSLQEKASAVDPLISTGNVEVVFPTLSKLNVTHNITKRQGGFEIQLSGLAEVASGPMIVLARVRQGENVENASAVIVFDR